MKGLRAIFGQYAGGAISAGSLSVVAVVAMLLVGYDRRTPFIYSKITLSPIPAVAGGEVMVRREIVWLRHCEGEGEVWREIIRPNGTISQYDRRYTRVPAELGLQVVVNRFSLDPAVLDNAEDEGVAVFRLSAVFHRCGITSSFSPVHGPVAEIPFHVKR